MEERVETRMRASSTAVSRDFQSSLICHLLQTFKQNSRRAVEIEPVGTSWERNSLVPAQLKDHKSPKLFHRSGRVCRSCDAVLKGSNFLDDQNPRAPTSKQAYEMCTGKKVVGGGEFVTYLMNSATVEVFVTYFQLT